VEVAAYRIVCEALTNISKHSQAAECDVRFMFNGGLEIEIRDNGTGMPQDARAGVGIYSMRERAAELGGTLTIRSNAGVGVRITAHLPFEVSSDEL
jgi:two-component system, NarL family, sensor kinase